MIKQKYLFQDEVKDQIEHGIRSAKKYIKIGAFLFQYIPTLELLSEASQRGVAVFILANDNKKNSLSDTTVVNLQHLSSKGCHVRYVDAIHAKFLIVDGENAMIMSANITNNSVTRNPENGIVIGSNEVNELEYAFDLLYIHADKIYGRNYDSRHVQVKKMEKNIPSDAFSHFQSKLKFTACLDGNLSLCHETGIYNEIVRLINESKEYVYIMSYNFPKVSMLPEFVKAIKQASCRGVKIYLYSRDANVKGIGESCTIIIDHNNHAKLVLSDVGGIVMTGNIDGTHSMTRGFEVGCLLEDDVFAYVLQHIRDLISKHN